MAFSPEDPRACDIDVRMTRLIKEMFAISAEYDVAISAGTRGESSYAYFNATEKDFEGDSIVDKYSFDGCDSFTDVTGMGKGRF